MPNDIGSLNAGLNLGNSILGPLALALYQKRQEARDDSRYADEKNYKAAMLDIARQKAGSRSPYTTLKTDNELFTRAKSELGEGATPEDIALRVQELKGEYGFSDQAPQIPSQPAQAVDPLQDPAVQQAASKAQVTIKDGKPTVKMDGLSAGIIATKAPQAMGMLGMSDPTKQTEAMAQGIPAIETDAELAQKADSLAQGVPSNPQADVQISALLKEAAVGKAMRPGVEAVTSSPQSLSSMQELALSKASPKTETTSSPSDKPENWDSMSAAQRVAWRKQNAPDPQMVKDITSTNAKKAAIVTQIEADLESLKDPNLSEAAKIKIAQGMIKTMNSKEGADAVGVEEAQRIGSLLEFRVPFVDGAAATWQRALDPADRNFGRDLPGFIEQADTIAKNIKRSINANNKQIGKKPMYNLEESKPKSSTNEFKSVEQAKAANLPKGTRIIINGRPAVIE